jgi:predicted MPP superfamily phosphohydrolase
MVAYLKGIANSSIMLAFAHVYLYWRLVHCTTTSRRRRGVLGACLGAAAALALLTNAFSRLLPVSVAQWVAWPGYLWWAVAFYLTIALVLLEIPRVISLLRRRSRQRAAQSMAVLATVGAPPTSDDTVADEAKPEPEVGRRQVLARSFAIAAGVASASTVAYGVSSAMGPPEVTHYPVPLKGLSPNLAGLRIATVADIHACAFHRRPHVERMVRMINDTRPDVVAVVGDLADGTVAQLGDDVTPLRDLRSTYGSYFVTGNHEYYAAVGDWLSLLRQLHVRPLLNERVDIGGAGGFDLAGVNDLSATDSGQPGPDVGHALADRDPSRPVVLMAHQPAMVDEAARNKVDLVLAGHTHGGQMQPLGLLKRLQGPSVSGWSTVDDTRMYVTRGIGTFGPPVRVGAAPEITVMQLQPGGAG